MGLSSSIQNRILIQSPALSAINQWPLVKVKAICKAYNEGDYDFGLTIENICELAECSIVHATEYVQRCHKVNRNQNINGVINAMTWLITIICLGGIDHYDVNHASLIFELFDFNESNLLTMNELVSWLSITSIYYYSY